MITEQFIGDLSRTLRGPHRVKRRLLEEAAAGLDDAVDRYREAGVEQPRAVTLAIADFGAVRQVSAAFQEELDIAKTRQLAFAHVLAAPLVAGLWNAVWELNPYEPRQVPVAAMLIAGVAALFIACGGAAGVTALVAAGRPDHRWPLERITQGLRAYTWWEGGAIVLAILALLVVAPGAFQSPLLLPALALTVLAFTLRRRAGTW